MLETKSQAINNAQIPTNSSSFLFCCCPRAFFVYSPAPQDPTWILCKLELAVQHGATRPRDGASQLPTLETDLSKTPEPLICSILRGANTHQRQDFVFFLILSINKMDLTQARSDGDRDSHSGQLPAQRRPQQHPTTTGSHLPPPSRSTGAR